MEISVEQNSPYYNGYIVDFGDGTYTLERPEDPTIYFNKVNGGEYYTTIDGDKLDAIANVKYGDELLWHKIYASNESIIPDPLQPLKGGLVLYIPNQTQFMP